MTSSINQKTLQENRESLENLLKRRFFVAPSFEIYGGVAGLYDYGPPGCALKLELESYWRKHFVLAEDMLEISATCLTPHNTLKASGHVDRFTDLMITDTKTNECYRADKIIEEHISKLIKEKSDKLSKEEKNKLEMVLIKAGSYGSEEVKECIKEYNIKTPSGDSDWSDPYPFNLMFKTKIGPKDKEVSDNIGYLRPETAQGIFVNFKRLFEYNSKKLPFSVAQIGLGFRNEIAPRNGLLRVREFQMAEIEHFVHPDKKNHSKFSLIKNMKLPLYSKEQQLNNIDYDNELTLEDAVYGEKKIIDNETLAYFLAKTYQFLINVGINPCGIRFRQHLDTEMAHYAKDCWDAEILTSYGWIECAGHADRSCYDLIQHTKSSKVDLVASEKYDEPIHKTVLEATLNKQLIGKTFKQESNIVTAALVDIAKNNSHEEFRERIEKSGSCILIYDNYKWEITSNMVKYEYKVKKISEEQFVPGVIEPSFGIGRIIHCIFEHNFKYRDTENRENQKQLEFVSNKDNSDMQRNYLSLPIIVAPIKCSILPISSNIVFNDLIDILHRSLVNYGISCKIDTSSASIGRRYARTDEIGIPFGITIDFQSIKDNTVTLRERDSMKQVRISSNEVVLVIFKIINQEIDWKHVIENYPIFVQQLND
ncbi:glycyl-tRNA synthetase [Cryptosporidium ryanae]|uniref:glycyl-tRNA synthetase n=1 Tax=Cryptosporidium ryanae TaxID=515981 RepID=UPI00351A024D|nr:glycyl-tRNA synthetase [Cryptosporidium ryanae]